MTPLLTSSSAADRIAYANSRRQGRDSLAEQQAAVNALRENINARVSSEGNTQAERQAEVSAIATEIIDDVESIRAFDAATEHLADLRGRVTTLNEKKEKLKQALSAAETQFRSENQHRRALVKHIEELRQENQKLKKESSNVLKTVVKTLVSTGIKIATQSPMS